MSSKCLYTLADVDYADLCAHLLCNDDGVGLGAAGGAKAGKSAGNDIGRGESHLLHCHGTDHNAQGGVNTAGNTHDTVVKTCVGHALYKAADLNINHAAAVVAHVLLQLGKMGKLAVSAGEHGLNFLAVPENAGVQEAVGGKLLSFRRRFSR